MQTLLMTSCPLTPLMRITNPKAWRRHVHISIHWLRNLLDAISAIHPCKTAQVSFLFTSNNTIRTLNKNYRGLDKPTNVLSFPSDIDNPLHPCLGDIALGFECIAEESQQLSITFEAHLVRMIIHGVLHLVGFDHQTPDEQAIMEQHEKMLLHNLGFNNYPFEDQTAL